MNASHDDAQRELEQRALRNVHDLARRLEKVDANARAKDRFIIAWVAGIAACIAAAVALVIWMTPDNKAEIESHRCELDAAVKIVDEMRADLKARDPALTKEDLERRVRVTNTDVKQEAKKRCAAGAK